MFNQTALCAASKLIFKFLHKKYNSSAACIVHIAQTVCCSHDTAALIIAVHIANSEHCLLLIIQYAGALQAVSNLSQCSALTELNLSTNALTSTAGLGALVQLKTLDLSCNEINKVTHHHNVQVLAVVILTPICFLKHSCCTFYMVLYDSTCVLSSQATVSCGVRLSKAAHRMWF
jgi:hypothetical protein